MEQWAIEEIENLMQNYTIPQILLHLQKVAQKNADAADDNPVYQYNMNVGASAINTARQTLIQAECR